MSQADVTSYRPLDLSYTPGDLTDPECRLPSHQQLINQKRHIEPDLPFSRLYLGDHKCQPVDHFRHTTEAAREVTTEVGRQFPALAAAQEHYTRQQKSSGCSSISDDNSAINVPSALRNSSYIEPGQNLISLPVSLPVMSHTSDFCTPKKMALHSITEKPNERCPSPVVPAYANFELAKRMHQDNLDHQPLPDCVADLAFRKAQINNGHAYAGLALDVDPIATGVGVKTHNAGPTHCTKMKVYRPKTGSVVPKVHAGDTFRDIGSAPNKKMGPMDLAICWDYKPDRPTNSPRLAKHIDGSNDSAGSAVFTCVKTSRESTAAELNRPVGVFTNTVGETDFFDKDILRRKTDLGGYHIERENTCICDYSQQPITRARSMSRDSSASHCRRGVGANTGVTFAELNGMTMPNRMSKQYQSSPMLNDKAYLALREKYLGLDSGVGCNTDSLMPHGCRQAGPSCKRDTPMRRPTRRLCHKMASSPKCCPSSFSSKTAFRTGVPKHNAVGDFVGVEAPCSTSGSTRVLVVPLPRNPYSKKNYDIDTLVPPFRRQAGSTAQGGYPEHWRLASVYQHAYKPMQQRRRPLLQTVYK